MKALTLKPEFADLVLSGAKLIENRTWGTHKQLKGQRIAIHRGGPGGALICTVVVKAVIDEETALRLFPKQKDHICGPLCWVLGEMQPIVPVVCSGKLGLWNIPSGVEITPLVIFSGKEDEERTAPSSIRRGVTIGTARAMAMELMVLHGLQGWTLEFDTATRRAGQCRYGRWPGQPGQIRLSLHYITRNDEADIRNTILHEIAHALVGPGHGHDETWKRKAQEIGARPERCYGEEVDMPKGNWRATCGGCGMEHHKHRKPKHLTGWWCRKCGRIKGQLVWQEEQT